MINKDNWLLELIEGKWRFIDHENKLLTYGWFDEFEADLDSVKLTDYWLVEYRTLYSETF